MPITAVPAYRRAPMILMNRPAAPKQTGGKPLMMIQLGAHRATWTGTRVGLPTGGRPSQRLALMCGRLRLGGTMESLIFIADHSQFPPTVLWRMRVLKHFRTMPRAGISMAPWSLKWRPVPVASYPSRLHRFIPAQTCWPCRSAMTTFR